MTWSASSRNASPSPRAAKNWKVPTRMWLVATRVSTAPGSTVSRTTGSPVGDRRERARGRDAERRHRLADDVFAQHRTERRAAVAAARERRRARALELDVAPHARAIDHLAQQDGAAVAELRHEVAELVAGIGERDRLRAGGEAVAGQDLDGLRRRQHVGIEAELAGQRLVDLDQARRRDRRRIEPGIEALRQPRIAVVEAQRPARRPVAALRAGS